MAIFLLYNLVNSLNASYEMLSEYYTEAYYSLFKSFVLITITLTLFVLSQKTIYTMNYIYYFSHFLCIKFITLYQTKWSQLILTKKGAANKNTIHLCRQCLLNLTTNTEYCIYVYLYQI